MSWKEKMKEWGGGNFTFLSEDGETIMFIVVGEPVLIHTKYQGKPQERIGCPVVTDDGFQLFITGKRTARKITKHEPVFGTSALMVTRRGAEGDTNAKYPVVVVPEPETFARLMAIKEEDFDPSMIAEAVEDAQKVMIS